MGPDEQAIQGLWRIVSYVARGKPVFSSATHYQFEENRVKEIAPSLVDDGRWSTYELQPECQPKRFTMISEWTGADGEAAQRADRWLYDLQGDSLRLCWPSVFGEYPDVLSDEEHGVVTLERDSGPPPETKAPSGKEPIQDPVLGQLTWNDNLDWWEGQVELRPDLKVMLHIEPGEERGDAEIAAAGRQLLAWVREHEPRAREFAAAELLDTHNDHWNDEQPISAGMFVDNMTLESISCYSGGSVELLYHDGDLFWGHCIIVSTDEVRQFTDANIAG